MEINEIFDITKQQDNLKNFKEKFNIPKQNFKEEYSYIKELNDLYGNGKDNECCFWIAVDKTGKMRGYHTLADCFCKDIRKPYMMVNLSELGKFIKNN